ncbi:hypothetical protein [Peribacillus butanolivorans]|uniref:hypothetical protein n=1 Tax=Peribacillus butanolivorans TaxID=421767 RepID=UPI0035E35ADE
MFHDIPFFKWNLFEHDTLISQMVAVPLFVIPSQKHKPSYLKCTLENLIGFFRHLADLFQKEKELPPAPDVNEGLIAPTHTD